MVLYIIGEIEADVRNGGMGRGRMDMLMEKVSMLKAQIQEGRSA